MLWHDSTAGIELASTYAGPTIPLKDLYAAIDSRGWEVTKVKWGTDGWDAEAKSADGRKIKKTAPTQESAVQHLLLALTHLDFMRVQAARAKIGMWGTTFTDELQPIADAYAKAPAYDPKAVEAFMELAHDSLRRLETLKGQMLVEIVDDPEPYASVEDMCEDIKKRKHLAVSRANADHPVWSPDQLVAFRAVHDVLGHCASGAADFGWLGENQACAAHFPLLSEPAQKALFSQCIAQTAYRLAYRGHGPQKLCLLDDEIEHAMAKENGGGHQGVHPSQALAPTETPEVPRVASMTRTKKLEQAAALDQEVGPDDSYTVHEFPDGWSIRGLSTVGDAHREGTLMGHCYAKPENANTPYKKEIWGNQDDYGDWRGPGDEGWYGWPEMAGLLDQYEEHLSLRDPDNLPHVTFQRDSEGDLHDAFARHNTEPDFAHVQRMKQWLAQDPNTNSDPYYYEDAYNHPTTAWPGSSFQDWWKYHHDFHQELYGHQASLGESIELTPPGFTPRQQGKPWKGAKFPDGRVYTWRINEAWGPNARPHHLDGVHAVAGKDYYFDESAGHEYLGSGYFGSGAEYGHADNVLDILRRRSDFHKNAGAVDPNHGWDSGVVPLVGINGQSLREMENDPLGIHRPNASGLTATDMASNLARIDPEDPSKRWWDLEHPDGSPAREEMKKAVVNAFSAVLLSPKTNLQWNTIHYQDLADVVHGSEDPNYLHKRLEQRRLEWNRARKISPLAHKPYYREQQDLARWLKSKDSSMTDEAAYMEAATQVRTLLEQEKVRIANELEVTEAGRPPEKRTTTSQIEIKAGNEVKRILRDIMAPGHNPVTDFSEQPSLFHTGAQHKYPQFPCPKCHRLGITAYEDLSIERYVPEARQARCDHCGYRFSIGQELGIPQKFEVDLLRSPEFMESVLSPADLSKLGPKHEGAHPPSQMSIAAPEGAAMDPSIVQMFDGSVNPEAMGAYGSWMGDHLKSIAQVSRHAEAILDIALRELQEHDGGGHHFRAYVLSLGIPGVGPKVTSFAWLLLAPELSQLATIDTHMLEALGHKPDEHPSPRDYFKLERQFRARLDAAGYQSLPLGLGQWAMWDYKRGGPDTHQDHAGLRPLNFVQHDNIDWAARAPKGKGSKWKAAPWWQETEGIGKQIGDHFDQTLGTHFRRDEIPFQDNPHYVMATSVDEFHVAWSVPEALRTKLTNWVTTLEWPEGYELEDPAQYHITVAYAKGGWKDTDQHALIKQFTSTDFPFESTGLELFGPDKDCVVLRLASKVATKWANRIMDALEANGLQVSRYDGYKAHITLGTASALPTGPKLDLSFRAGKLYVSQPRALVEIDTHPVFSALGDRSPVVTHPDGDSDVGAPGETIMQYLRGQLGLSTEEAWQFPGAVTKIGP